jgi:hypothetical protein
MSRRLWCVVLIALCAWNAAAQFDQPANPDSLRSDSVTSWPDTSVAFSDTLIPPPKAPLHQGWLYPLGVAAVTCLGFILLYTMRSR